MVKDPKINKGTPLPSKGVTKDTLAKGIIKWDKGNGKTVLTNDRPETVDAAKKLGWKLLK